MFWQRVCIFALLAILTSWAEPESCLEQGSLLQVSVFKGGTYGDQKTAVNCTDAQKVFLSQVGCDNSIFTSKAACEDQRAMYTYLASYPGSGNTWLRSNLEGITRFFTGSKYCDSTLLAAGFKGECSQDPANVLIVKTHSPCGRGCGTKFLLNYDIPFETEVANQSSQALVLVRHPLDAILAECQRKVAHQMHPANSSDDNQHAAEVPLQLLVPYVESEFEGMIKSWKHHTEWWTKEFSGRQISVRYEDLNRGEIYLQQILPFLKVDTSRPDILRSLTCQLQGDSMEGTHRLHSYTYKFTREQIEMARKTVGHLLPMFNYTLPLP